MGRQLLISLAEQETGVGSNQNVAVVGAPPTRRAPPGARDVITAHYSSVCAGGGRDTGHYGAHV